MARIVFVTSPKKGWFWLLGCFSDRSAVEVQTWPIIGQIQFFEVKSIDSTSRVIPKDIDVLLLVHPTILKDSFRYAIDQFVMRGGES